MKFQMGGQQALSGQICCPNEDQLWSQIRLLRASCSCILKSFTEGKCATSLKSSSCAGLLLWISVSTSWSALMECSFSLKLTYYGKSTFFIVSRLHHLAAGVAQTLRNLCAEINYLDCGIGSGQSHGPTQESQFQGFSQQNLQLDWDSLRCSSAHFIQSACLWEYMTTSVCVW